jgi:cardiolipin synthase
MLSLMRHLHDPDPAGKGAILLFCFAVLLALFVAGHVISTKRDPRSAVAWLILIVFVPLLGAVVYLWIGVNRVERRARHLGRPMPRSLSAGSSESVPESVPGDLRGLLALTDRINATPLTAGNSIRLLVNGDEAYPRMLNAIRDAKKTITFVSYIFDNDPVGREFAEALCLAAERGVQVRVLVDAIGARYTFPSIFRRLRARNLRAARFLDTWMPWRFHYSQLRNHRKCLIVDGGVAFTGGMNIRQAHLVTMARPDSTQDLEFRVEGPAVGELQEVFAQDWEYSTGERLEGEDWFPPLAPVDGGALVRVDNPRCDPRGAAIGAHPHSLFSARSRGGEHAQPGCSAGREGGDSAARSK